ncbi:Peptidase family M23 [Christiangramia echinicola]|uniref:Peptidase family M23 n=2 Tax=Christiangramia echinicola TaxID=279359 RepID=A0A1H1MDI3_9FLAO|nr:Peptidase family M23 [Christiangramia echinicola]
MEKAEQLITGLTEKEKYQKDNEISDELFQIWEDRVKVALRDSLEIELPYTESGELKPRNFAVYSYQTYLIPGEVIEAKFITDSSFTLVFSELYKKVKDQNKSFERVKSAEGETKKLRFEVQEKGLYKLIFQPEIEANTPFHIQIKKSPTYLFPVSNGKNADIGSYWGDIRDGGRRDHKGIDIFADRGTPVVAATSGRIRFTGEKGLGGKQVWLRDRKRRQSLYYAHLDSIIPGLNKVEQGDTLGFVGNSGNARTTPPHLHFGIYKSKQGALDPIGFVYLTEDAQDISANNSEFATRLKVNSAKANFRNKPASSNSRVVKTGQEGELLFVQGKTTDWFHVRDSLDRSMYIHESLVRSAY